MTKKVYNINIMGIHWKIRFLRGVQEKPIYRGELPKKGVLDSFDRFNKGGGLAKKRGWYF